MAKILRTGFELPFAVSGEDTTKTYSSFSQLNSYVFDGVAKGYANWNYTSANQVLSNSPSAFTGTFRNDTIARTLSDGTRGGHFCLGQAILALDETMFTSGCYFNYWHKSKSGATYQLLAGWRDSTTSYIAQIKISTGEIEIRNATTNTQLASDTVSYSYETWYNVSGGVDNSGNLTLTFNGTTITYAVGGSPAFSTWEQLYLCFTWSSSSFLSSMDDLALNDGSGASDNGEPVSIRGYNSFIAASLDSSSDFNTVGGSSLFDNLTDGDLTTRVSSSVDGANMVFNAASLGGMGISESKSNFSGICMINARALQIEATKAGSVMKVKISDTTAVVEREENISAPQTVDAKMVAFPDDGTDPWDLDNFDSESFTTTLTFDEP